jgi:hypothetical protein
MQIRPRRTKVASNDFLLPRLSNLTEEGIQDIIKSRISQKDFSDFLEKKINEDTIEDYRKLLELKGNLYAIPGEPSSNKIENDKKRKYLFDLIMVVLYEELLTYNQIISVVQTNGVLISINIFEKMVVLEYELFILTKNITETTKTFFKKYIADNLINIYHSTKNFSSYRNLANIEEELQKIYTATLAATPYSGTLPSILSSIGDFNYKSLVRINGQLATVEKENQSKYLFILNYNSYEDEEENIIYDRSYIRKYWALTDKNAYYIKNGIKIYFDGLTDYSYYELFDSEYNEDYAEAHNFLTKLWENITQRTINY